MGAGAELLPVSPVVGPAGAVVDVVVVVEVDWRTTTCTRLTEGAGGGATDVEVEGITGREPCPEVVVVVLGGTWRGERGLPERGVGDAATACRGRLPARGLVVVLAATRARSESDTASTTHQCGRARTGRLPADPDSVVSPPTRRP